MKKTDTPDSDIEPTHGGGRRNAEKKGSDEAALTKVRNVREMPVDQKEVAPERKEKRER